MTVDDMTDPEMEDGVYGDEESWFQQFETGFFYLHYESMKKDNAVSSDAKVAIWMASLNSTVERSN